MRVAIFGAGAVGSVLGARLAREHEVLLIGRAPHMRAVARSGLHVEGTTRGTFPLDVATRASAAKGADLVFLTVKSFDTAAAAAQLKAAGITAPVVTLQNGLTNVAVLKRGLPRAPIVGGSLILGALSLGPGRVRHTGAGRAVVGAVRGPASALQEAGAALRGARIPTRIAPDLDAVLWQKAIVNASVNPVTAILRCANAALLRRPEAMLVARSAALEATRVARAAQVDAPADPWPAIVRILQETAENRTSMLQDVEAGRPTEIDAITGEIVRVGNRVKVAVPVNSALLRLVLSL